MQAFEYVHTKDDGGDFQGTLNLGGASRINIVANDNEESGKQPLHLRHFDTRGQELGTFRGWFKTGEVSGKDYISSAFVHLALGPRKVSFQSWSGLWQRGHMNLLCL